MLDPREGGASASPGRFAGPTELVAGVRVADRYRIERRLGEGGTSTVLACVDERSGRRVALKLLRTPLPKDAERLIREARILEALESEHITRLVDSGMLSSGEPYLVTELVDGKDLAGVLRERGRLSVREACDVVCQACLALEEAHAKGVVHRDIKPGNVLVTLRPDGTNLVKLVDFGISRSVAAKADDGTLTESNELLGTPRYMALEQIKDPRSADARADIFSLGALLYRLLTGRYAFHGETAAEVIINIASVPAPSLLEARPDAPAGLDAIVRKCLAKSADARVQTAAELRKLITATISGMSEASAAPLTEPAAHAAPPAPLLPKRTRPHVATMALLGAGLLVVPASFVIDRAMRRGHEAAPPPSASVSTLAVADSGEVAADVPQKVSSVAPQEVSSVAPGPAPAATVSTGPSPRLGRPARAHGKGRPGAPPASGSPSSPREFEVDVDTTSRQ